MVSVPNTELVRKGLEREDLFTVVHDQFITDTARYADIVLPATTQIEATDAVTPWGHLYLGWNEAAIEPRGEAVSNSELHRRLAKAMGFTEPALFEDDLTALRAALPTIDFDELRAEGVVKVPYPEDGRPFADGGFPTRSGKVELRCDALVALGQPALPTYSEPSEAAFRGRFPFALLTPKQHTRFLNSSYSQLPKHGPLEGGPFLELCDKDAADLGLAAGRAGPRVERPRRDGRAGAHHRTTAPRCGRGAVGLVGRRSRRRRQHRRPGRQLTDQRHPHRLGRRRRLQRHPRRHLPRLTQHSGAVTSAPLRRR